MRLTLRTLLAYLDDTLDAGEIKHIGQKVAESDAAQELIARIKQVTRRRRLTVPPATGPQGVEPNNVAEYLDNCLSSEQLAEFEKQALENDVQLAEIAACHQILTLVLGEPALVPPKSKERMYGLVHGREAIPYRKAQPPKKKGAAVLDEDDDLGLSAGWLRWVLPVAGILLIFALGLAVWQILPPTKPDTRQANLKGDENQNKDKDTDNKEKEGRLKNEEKDTKDGKDKGGPAKNVTGTGTGGNSGNNTPPVKPEKKDPVTERIKPPSKKRVAVASYQGGLKDIPANLLVRQQDTDTWLRPDTRANSQLYSTDTLLTLPGFAGYIQTRKDVGLALRGSLREYALAGPLLYINEAAVILHDNDEFDLDLTLLRGRIYLTNRKAKGPAKIRLRFENEAWDITLESQDAEVGIDLLRTFTPLINYRKKEPPLAQCYLAVLLGEVRIKVDVYHTHAMEADPPRWKRMDWDSFTKIRGPFTETEQPVAWGKMPPGEGLGLPEARILAIRKMAQATKDLEVMLTSPTKPLDIALKETLEKDKPADRLLAIYCLAAIDEIGRIIDVLGDPDPLHAVDREAAFYIMQRWICRDANQTTKLYDEKTEQGLLTKTYKKPEAQGIIQLLHPLLLEDLNKVETYETLARALQHRRIAIAEMAYWHLVYISGQVKLPDDFNAAYKLDDRRRYSEQVLSMIEKKILPPRGGGPGEKEKEKEKGN